MKKALSFIWNKFEEILIFVFFLIIMLTVTLQIFNREFIGATIIWTEELARFFYVWIAYVGFAYVVKKRNNLRIDVLLEYVGEKGRNIYSLIEHLITLVFAVWMFIVFCDYIVFTSATMAPALRIPIRYFYIMLPISMVMLFVRTTVCFIQDIMALGQKKVAKSEEVN